jgi:hypothetical protein
VSARGSRPECLRKQRPRAVRAGVDQRRQGGALGGLGQQCLADELNIGVGRIGGSVSTDGLGWIQNGRKGLVYFASVMIDPTGRPYGKRRIRFRVPASRGRRYTGRSAPFRPRQRRIRETRVHGLCFPRRGLALGVTRVRHPRRRICRRHAVESGLMIRERVGGRDCRGSHWRRRTL